jgi:3-isopropylmalate dehydrogenase
MWMVKSPEWFDVLVTGNMFGDIITDLGAMTQGGMGLAAGGNINPKGVSMFEPIGGSAPKYTGQNVINPLAAICAGMMMLDDLGEKKAAGWIEKSVVKAIANMDSLAAGKMGMGTDQVGSMVAKFVKEA